MNAPNEFEIYLFTFLTLVAAGLGFPIPEEIPIVGAGAYAGTHCGITPKEVAPAIGVLGAIPGAGLPAALPWPALAYLDQHLDSPITVRWWLFLPICILGVVLSDGMLYGMGRLFGTRLLDLPFMTRLMPARKRQQIQDSFHRSGVKILLFARFMPGIRAPIFITAGMMRLPLHHFLLADGLYAIVGVSLLFFLSFWFTNTFVDLVENIENHVMEWRPVVIMALIVGVVGFLLYRYFRKPNIEETVIQQPSLGDAGISCDPAATAKNDEISQKP